MKLHAQILFLITVLLMVSCKRPPEYPTTPEISNARISKITVSKSQPGGLTYFEDSVVISCDFKDGDGDLGTSNNLQTNYYADVFLKKDNEFVQIYDSTTKSIINKNGTFFSLNPDGRQGPIEGTLNYGVSTKLLILKMEEYTLKFKVAIKDNSGKLSNALETQEVTVRYYSQ